MRGGRSHERLGAAAIAAMRGSRSSCAPSGPGPGQVDPVVRKRYVELPPPTRDDDTADLLRLEKAFGPLHVDLDLLRRTAAHDFAGKRFSRHGRGGRWLAVDFEPRQQRVGRLRRGPGPGHEPTLAAALVRRPQRSRTGGGGPIESADPLRRRRGLPHPPRSHQIQMPCGQLQATITQAVDEMIGELCQEAGLSRRHVYEITVAGNTTMQQIFCGVDPGRWARCRLFPPPAAACCFGCPAGVEHSVRAAGPGCCRPSAVSWAATRWPASWPPA